MTATEERADRPGTRLTPIRHRFGLTGPAMEENPDARSVYTG
ncbi:hypothetical protein AB0D74_42315 [Streptomyces sp. NPDC048278]